MEAPQRHDLQSRLLDDPYVIAVPGAAPAQQVLRGVPVQEPVEPRVVRPSVLEEEDLAAGRCSHGDGRQGAGDGRTAPHDTGDGCATPC